MAKTKREVAREAWQRALDPDAGKIFNVDLEGLATILVAGRKKSARLEPTQRDFIFCPSRRAIYKGRLGAAKTSSLVTSVIIPCLLYPGSRWVVARAVYWTLEHTTLERFRECLGRLGKGQIVQELEGPPYQIYLKPIVPGPPSHITFHGLDDFSKWGSVELHGVGVDEVTDIDEKMAQTLDERLRRPYPGEEGEQPKGPFFWRGACNPPPKGHWVHRFFCGDDVCGESDDLCLRPPWGTLFKPQRGENERNLPAGYYDEKAQGKSAADRIRLIVGECGPDSSGQPVFGDALFNEMLHVGDFKYRPDLPMGRSWDGGRRRPSCTWFQKMPTGHIIRFLNIIGDNKDIGKFVDQVVLTGNSVFPEIKEYFDFVDPHMYNKQSTSDRSDVDIMRQKGVNPAPRKDTLIKTGLDLMSQSLSTMAAFGQLGPKPLSLYHKPGCRNLIEGYQSGYKWPERKPSGEEPEKPLADGWYEHSMDTDRYIEVNMRLGTKGKDTKARSLRKIRNPVTGY